jgi:Glycosyl hydrolases family 43
MIKQLSEKLRMRVKLAILRSAAALAVMAGALAIPASAIAQTSAVQAPAAKAPSTQTLARVNLADPGFSEFNGKFYIYGTGEKFPVATSVKWNGPYKGQGTVLAAQPKWLGSCPTFGNAEWAPQVFRSQNTYVMYYTACDGGVRPLANCVGIATSSSPASGFRPVGKPVCAPSSQEAGSEAIDPSPYQVAGRRYTLFKTSYKNANAWTIWAVGMNSSGTAVDGTPRALIRPGSITEAPFALNHGGKVWLFVARNSFSSCAYSTDVYVANGLTGSYKRVGSLLSQATTGLCGPGGASLTWTGNTYYIAYHAWENGTPKSNTRTTYVAELGWRANGDPYVK